jgi:hypothetical protein
MKFWGVIAAMLGAVLIIGSLFIMYGGDDNTPRCAGTLICEEE